MALPLVCSPPASSSAMVKETDQSVASSDSNCSDIGKSPKSLFFGVVLVNELFITNYEGLLKHINFLLMIIKLMSGIPSMKFSLRKALFLYH